jgi:hypothetical protein
MSLRLEEPRALLARGYPDALTVEPDGLAELREAEHLARANKVAALTLFALLVLLAFFFALLSSVD